MRRCFFFQQLTLPKIRSSNVVCIHSIEMSGGLATRFLESAEIGRKETEVENGREGRYRNSSWDHVIECREKTPRSNFMYLAITFSKFAFTEATAPRKECDFERHFAKSEGTGCSACFGPHAHLLSSLSLSLSLSLSCFLSFLLTYPFPLGAFLLAESL